MTALLSGNPLSPRITRVSGLIPIDEEAFLHGQLEREGMERAARHDYEGGPGDDEDISDLTAEQTLGLHSTFEADIYLGAANDNQPPDEDDASYDAKDIAA